MGTKQLRSSHATCGNGRAKRLALRHHDPDHDDEFLERIEKLCQERFPNAVLAREGMEMWIGEAI
jgi:phosphoribosyl 1,2-cyclic phosphodiesterase